MVRQDVSTSSYPVGMTVDNHCVTIEWPGEDGRTLVYTITRPTREAALRARIERIKELSRRYPKRRTVEVRGA